jgi:hypothetical protein
MSTPRFQLASFLALIALLATGTGLLRTAHLTFDHAPDAPSRCACVHHGPATPDTPDPQPNNPDDHDCAVCLALVAASKATPDAEPSMAPTLEHSDFLVLIEPEQCAAKRTPMPPVRGPPVLPADA